MTRAEKRKFHYIYKTTCSITNKFYIGMHSTDSLEDGYVGSGKLLWYSIHKHGKENHNTEILEFLSSREELKSREEHLVNEELLDQKLCMNLKLGGEGGFPKHTDAIKDKISKSKIGKKRTEDTINKIRITANSNVSLGIGKVRKRFLKSEEAKHKICSSAHGRELFYLLTSPEGLVYKTSKYKTLKTLCAELNLKHRTVYESAHFKRNPIRGTFYLWKVEIVK